MYIRFVVGSEKEDPKWLHGVITEARLLKDENKLYEYEIKIVDDVFEWFNQNLPCPSFESSNWPSNAISWFKEDAQEYISKLWELISILKEHDVPVRAIKSSDPGNKLYEDEFQIVAMGSKY